MKELSFNNCYEGPFVWNGRTLDMQDEWIVQLDESDIATIETAVAATRSTTLEQLSCKDFEFGSLGDKLAAVSNEVLHGKGFVVIRGLPGDQWSDEDLVRAYWGIGQWLGEPVSQNANGHLLGHVIDKRRQLQINKQGVDSTATRIYQTNRAQPFHSDSCDIVGLLCLRKAKTGGASAIASSAAIFNELYANDTDSLRVLCDSFQCDRYGEIPAGKHSWYSINVFNHIDGKLVCCGMDPDIRSAQRLDDVQPLTITQLDALDAFQNTASKLALNMTLERGDIQLVNNHVVVHARSSFEDDDDLDKRRYMVRLWLSSPNGRHLPAFLAERWGNIEVGTRRGGISVPGALPVVHLDPNE